MSNLNETIKNLGPARIAILGATFLSLIIFFIFVSAKVSQPSMEILYRDLTTTDSAQVSAQLEESGIRYSVSNDGSQVFVSQDEVGRARMLLAEQGLPNGGSLGYEIFDQQSGFGTTSFVQNINQVRALQGELAKTISSLDPVQFSKVHIVLPQRELFSRESRDASASVTLKLQANGRLAREQIYGIQNLVANAVPDLKAENVTIIDTDANMLAGGGSSDPETMMGLKAEEMRRAYEKRLGQAVEDIVGRTVGYNKVRAHVTADLDFDRISTNDEIYDPEGQVVRSTQSISEDNIERDNQSNQDVTVENNLPGLGDDFGGNDPTLQANRSEEITNYEISKTVRSTVRESGEVTRLSVAVLVDGRYTTNEAGERVYEPRAQEELDKIATLVRSTVGFEEDRGDTIEVVNMPFTDMGDTTFDVQEDLLFGFEKSEVLNFGEMIMLVVMGILVVLLVLRPLVSSIVMSQKAALDQAKEEAALLAASDTPAALAGPTAYEQKGESGGGSDRQERDEEDDDNMLDMQAVEGRVKASSVKKIGDIVSSHPNETVSVIRNWMAQE